MRTLEVPIDENIRKRIRKRRNELEFTQSEVYSKCSSKGSEITIDMIKHLERKDGVKTAKKRYIDDIADALRCTSDYLLCLSDEPDHSANGRKKKFPIDDTPIDKQLIVINRFLRENDKARQSLYFIAERIPSMQRNLMIDSIYGYVSLLKDYSFLEDYGKGLFNINNLESVKRALTRKDENVIERIELYSRARDLIVRNQYKEALYYYMKFIGEGISDNRIHDQFFEWSLDSVKKITTIWSSYKNDYCTYYDPMIRLTDKAIRKHREALYTIPVENAWRSISGNPIIKPKKQRPKLDASESDGDRDLRTMSDRYDRTVILMQELEKEQEWLHKELAKVQYSPKKNESPKKSVPEKSSDS